MAATRPGRRRRVLIPAAAAVASAALVGVAAVSATDRSGVYKLAVGPAGGGHSHVEWIAPETGAWRMDAGGRTKIFTGSTYAVTDALGTYVRTGSPSFLRGLANLPVADDALRAYLGGEAAQRGVRVARRDDGRIELRFSANGRQLVATIEGTGSADALFSVPAAANGARTEAREIRPRDPLTIDVRPYWFGQTIGDRSAVTAVQHETVVPKSFVETGAFSEADNVAIYIVFYELASAVGEGSAIPGRDAPAGELQVVSQAITSAGARQDLAAFDGNSFDLKTKVWPRMGVTLAGGERATVFTEPAEGTGEIVNRFAVATPTTLVNVSGAIRRDDVPALAAALQPVSG